MTVIVEREGGVGTEKGDIEKAASVFCLLPSFSVAEFIVPDWGDKVNSGIRLSYLPAMLHRLAGRYDNPMPESTISPSQGL